MPSEYGVLHDGGELYLVCSADGTVSFMSTALRLIAKEDCVGRNIRTLLPHSAADALHELAYGHMLPELPLQLGGSAFRAYITADGDGMVVSLRQSTSPISESRQKRMQEINREFSSYLSLMTASVDSISRGATLSEDGVHALSLLRQNIFRILRLSRNLLDAALFENGELRTVLREGDLSDFLAQLSNRIVPLCRASGVEMEVILPEGCVLCRFDAEKVERILLSLIAGAFTSGTIRLILADRGDHVVLTVSGLSAQFSQLGEDLSAVSSIGSGFAIASSFSRALGGTFVVSGSPSTGYSACIALPKNLDRDTAPLNSLQVDYAGGYDHVLVELSTVLDKQFYR